MIAYLRGEVVSVTEKQLVLDVNHVGFSVQICARDAAAMPAAGDEVTVFTRMNVREDDISLVGFLHEDDLDIYSMLIGVGGIGPRGGLSILSVLSAEDVRMAILADDSKTIAKAPGIGAKTAKKVILELKDKISASDMLERMRQKEMQDPAAGAFEANREEAVQVMTALGYSRSEALRMVRAAALTEDMDVDSILTAAFRERG